MLSCPHSMIFKLAKLITPMLCCMNLRNLIILWFWWHFQFVTNSCTFRSNIIWGWKSQILVTKLFFRILWIISKICIFPSTIYVLWKLLILVTNVVTRLDIFGTVTRSVTNVCNFYSNILKGVSYWYLLQLFINL